MQVHNDDVRPFNFTGYTQIVSMGVAVRVAAMSHEVFLCSSSQCWLTRAGLILGFQGRAGLRAQGRAHSWISKHMKCCCTSCALSGNSQMSVLLSTISDSDWVFADLGQTAFRTQFLSYR